MPWNWDPDKDRINRRVHGIGFDTASKVFDDPLALSRVDSYPFEQRWQTVGDIAGVTVLVVHTWLEVGSNGNEFEGRIISARKATRSERKAYEEGDF